MSPARKLLLLNIGWWLMVSCLHLIIIMHFGFSLQVKLTDSFVSYLLLAVFSVVITRSMRFYLPQREKYLYVVIVSAAVTNIWLLLSRLLLSNIFHANADYLRYQSDTLGLRFGISFLSFTCLILISLLWYNQQEQKEMMKRNAEAEQLTKDAELYKLRQQLQPHFLFNSLNSISALTGTQPEKARHMINQLSEFLRGTLKKDEKQFNTLEEEMQYLQLYLEIEKVRFGYRLQTSIFCDEDALPLQLPAMILQPVVENAIKFGLYDTTDEVLIKVEAKKLDGNLKVVVENPFDPETSQPLKGTGFGLASIQRRLFLLFARQDLLQIEKQGNRFTTTILIPQKI